MASSKKRLTRPLNEMQRLFIAAYVEKPNATRAAIKAGYSERTAHVQGHELLKHPKIKEEIHKRLERISARYEVSRERVIAELAKLGLSNMGDFTRIDEKTGDVYTDFSAVDRDQMAAVQELTVEEYTEGRGDDARAIKRTKFKLADKKGALLELAKINGWMIDKVEHTGANGGPIQQSHLIQIGDLAPEQREQLRAILLVAKRPATITDVEVEEVEEVDDET